MKVGDLVKHYDQLYAGLGIVIGAAKHPSVQTMYARVQYGDVTDWIAIEDLEVINESR